MKLNLGSGKSKKDGFIGVDVDDFGQDVIADLREPWKWDDNSIDEVYSAHFVEHLTAPERIHFANELYRVLKPGATAEIITPHWSSLRAFGDLTHQWPPVSEHWFFHLRKSWREEHAPHSCKLYTCDFDVNFGVRLASDVVVRNQEYQQFAARFYTNACDDLVATWIKREA